MLTPISRLLILRIVIYLQLFAVENIRFYCFIKFFIRVIHVYIKSHIFCKLINCKNNFLIQYLDDLRHTNQLFFTQKLFVINYYIKYIILLFENLFYLLIKYFESLLITKIIINVPKLIV